MDARITLFNSNKTDLIKQDHKKKITENLKILRVSDASIQSIFATVEKMPAAEHILVALNFLTEITDKHSQCEHFYLHSDYLAEFFCTLSNIGFFAVAYYQRDLVTLAVGIFSTISHAIPLKRLNDLDKLAAVSAFLYVLANYDVVLASPAILIASLITAGFGIVDMAIGRPNKDIFGSTFHVLWHFAVAFALFQFNDAKVDKLRMTL